MSTFATPSPSKISRYSRYGSWQVLAEAQFQRGLVTDTAPVALPAGAVADARDFLFDRPGKIRKRGGSAIRTTLPGMSGAAAVAFAPFSVGDKLVAVGVSGGSFSVFEAGPPTGISIGSVFPSFNPPVFYDDRLYLLQSAAAPKIVTNAGGTLTLAASTIGTNAYVGATHAGYLVLANDQGSHANRLWFSPIPDPTVAWDLANAYIDTAGPITGLASIQGVLLVFHAGSSERVLGSIPPGTVGENMSLQPLSGQAGCLDPGAIVPIGGNVYFADNSGVWVTNGASVTSITQRPDATGISSLWRRYITDAGNAVAGGGERAVRGGSFGNDYYMVTIQQHPSGGAWAGTLFLVYHIATGAWSRFNIHAISSFAASPQALETFAATTNSPYVVKLSDLYAEAPANAADADAAAVSPTVTSRVMGTGPFEKAFGDGHLTYDMRSDTGATLALTYSRDIEQQTFQSSATFAGATVPTRQRFPVSGDGHGFSWRIAQTGASTKTELYAVEIEHRNYEEQADG